MILVTAPTLIVLYQLLCGHISEVTSLYSHFQTSSCWPSWTIGLSSLSQELRVHLNHWSCLFSKVQSDHHLRHALVHQTMLLAKVKENLDSLGLQALILMERYVCVILSALAQTDLECVSIEVLQDILAGTDLYNQAVEDQRAQHGTTQLRAAVLLRAHHSTVNPGLPHSKKHHPAAFSVRELTVILAVHHAQTAAEWLQSGTSAQNCQFFQDQVNSVKSSSSCGTCRQRSEWIWEQLQHTKCIPPTLLSVDLQPALQPHLGNTENHHPTSISVQCSTASSSKDLANQCQTYIPQTSSVQTGMEPVDSHRDPSQSSHHLPAPPLPLSAVCQQERSSVALLSQLLVSCSDLLVPLVSHTEAPDEQLVPHAKTDISSTIRNTDPLTVTATTLSTADSVEINRLSTDLNQNQNVEGTQADWAELGIITRLETTCR